MQKPSPKNTPPDQLALVYTDQDIVIVNKPPNFLSVPGKSVENFDSVQTRLKTEFPEAMCAHRLDLDTSGVLIVALHKKALKELNLQFQNRLVKKTYSAIIAGIPENNSGEINLPLRCDWPNRPRQMVCYEHGKKAITHYTTVSSDTESNSSLVTLSPITGRAHQLRIHMNEIGHPILGCNLYGNSTSYNAASRLLLHAQTLDFTHPISGKKMSITQDPDF